MHLSMMLLWVFAFALVVLGAPRPGLEDTTSWSTDVYSSTIRSGIVSYPSSVLHSTISSSILHGYGSSTFSELSSHHYSILGSATSVVTYVPSSATHSVSPSHHPSISYSTTPHLTKSASIHSSHPSPTCHPKMNSYLIKVEHDSLCDDLKEYSYLIYTPPDNSSISSYPVGSIGHTIYKPDTFVTLFFIFSGDLTCGNATLAQHPKAYPHHHAPSSTYAEYLFILIGESYPVGIAHQLPAASVGYMKFGTDEYGHLTFAGVQKWAVCWSSSSGEKTGYVYWLGEGGECPENCVMDVKLRLVPYGFPSDHDYHHHGYPKSTSVDSTYPYETCSTGYEVSSPSYVPTYTVPTIPSSTKDTSGEYTSCDTSASSYSYIGGKDTYIPYTGHSSYTSTEFCSESEIYPTSTYPSSETCTESTPDTKSTKLASSETCYESQVYPTSTYTSSESCSESEISPTWTYSSSETCTESTPYSSPTTHASSETCSESEIYPTSTYTSSETSCTESDTHPTYTSYASSETCTESQSYLQPTSTYTTSETCTESGTHLTPTYPSSETCSDSETYPTSTVTWGSYPSSYTSGYEDCDDDDYSYYSSYYSHYYPTSTDSECTSSTSLSSKVYLTSTPKTSPVYVKSVSSKPTY